MGVATQGRDYGHQTAFFEEVAGGEGNGDGEHLIYGYIEVRGRLQDAIGIGKLMGRPIARDGAFFYRTRAAATHYVEGRRIG
ncbi:MAG TPA: hypothetical protein DCR93_09165, partial [Cytophagales bacterium]|nr:hypothetical protein [Cytophagales bacterium]